MYEEVNDKHKLKTALRVGFFLAYRDIKRANIWTTALIIAVMVLTFLNLVVVSGILVGLIDGIIEANNKIYTGQIVITSLPEKSYIERSQDIMRAIHTQPDTVAVNGRYTASGRIEANYKDRKRQTDLVDYAGGIVTGIDPDIEEQYSGISNYIVEGSFLEKNDYDKIVVGAGLLYKYTPIDSADMRVLKNVEVGSKVRLIINGITREMTVKGVVKTKVSEIDQRIFLTDSQFRLLTNRYDFNMNEITVKIDPKTDPENYKNRIIATGADQYAKVQTAAEAEPKFVKDIKSTFSILGNMIGSIGLVVASITIFIVVFVNAITRRRYIGIMKGIGVSSFAIEISYVIQSLFYASFGIIIGTFIVFGILKPYFDANPINFPFSDGILVATFSGTAIRILILSIATIIAGYIPAKIVVKQNTLNAILGR